MPDPVVPGALVEDDGAGHGGGFGGGASQGGVPGQALVGEALGVAEELTVEANDDGGAGGFGGIDDALEGFEVPTLEVTDGVAVGEGVLQEVDGGPEGHWLGPGV